MSHADAGFEPATMETRSGRFLSSHLKVAIICEIKPVERYFPFFISYRTNVINKDGPLA